MDKLDLMLTESFFKIILRMLQNLLLSAKGVNKYAPDSQPNLRYVREKKVVRFLVTVI